MDEREIVTRSRKYEKISRRCTSTVTVETAIVRKEVIQKPQLKTHIFLSPL
jgi:hypothetical protein